MTSPVGIQNQLNFKDSKWNHWLIRYAKSASKGEIYLTALSKSAIGF